MDIQEGVSVTLARPFFCSASCGSKKPRGCEQHHGDTLKVQDMSNDTLQRYKNTGPDEFQAPAPQWYREYKLVAIPKHLTTNLTKTVW